jgi:hypothetical protein
MHEKGRQFRARTASQDHPVFFHHLAHSCLALFPKSENQLLHFQWRAHDFGEMGGAPFSKQ